MPTLRDLPEPVRGRLADGREILLFGDRHECVLGTDRRDLPQRPDRPVSSVRYDPATGDHVIIAPARQERTYRPPRQMCPLCADPEGLSSEVPGDGYRVAVFENRFPSLTGVADERVGADPLRAESAGAGRCEVVCFTSDHDGSFAALADVDARLVLDVWAHRTAELFARDDVAEVHCFENRGAEIGVTLPHPHGQIYAYPFLTRRTDSMLRRAAEHP